jgi:hypothetical protein
VSPHLSTPVSPLFFWALFPPLTDDANFALVLDCQGSWRSTRPTPGRYCGMRSTRLLSDLLQQLISVPIIE